MTDGKELHVLIIEDSEDDALLVLREFKRGGIDVFSQRVFTVDGLKDALLRQDWDVVITDHNMPGFTSADAIRIVHELGMDIPLIIVSGRIGEELAVASMKSGAHDYIMKNNLARLVPVVERELREAINRREQRDTEAALLASECHFRAYFEQALIGMASARAEKGWLEVNDALCRMLGYSREELMRMNWAELTHPDDLYENLKLYERILSGEIDSYTIENRLIRKDGEAIHVHRTQQAIRKPDGSIDYIVAIVEDITVRKHAEDELQLASMVYNNSSEAMMITDEKNRIIAINPAFTKITGYTMDDVSGQNPGLLKSGKHDEDFYRNLWNEVKMRGSWHGQIWNRRKSGDIYPEWLTINTIQNPDDSVHRHVALFSDITDKLRTDELIWRQANFDLLTNLPNRRMFHDRLEQEIKKAHRGKSRIALLFIDLDHFKEINDTLGHHMGDKLLIEAAQRIASCVRESDTVARLGGDEFTIVLSEFPDGIHVEKIAQLLLEKLASPFLLGTEPAYVSASIGITFFPDDALNLEQLLRNADQAMYMAKNAGRNRLGYFTSELQEKAQLRIKLLNDLRVALAANQFALYFQPVVNLITGRVIKAEALLRWIHPVRGMVSPMDFIPLAEESGLIIEIGAWVFMEAARCASRWVAYVPDDFQISVNASPVQFQNNDDDSMDKWLSYLCELGLSGMHFVIEITESLLLNADAGITDKLLRFRDAGIEIAIDDFGTGYSSLAYLKKLDIDYLKIDKSFVEDIASDASDMALTEAIVMMAHKLGLKVIAEGVETQAQKDRLIAAGCDYGQGYLFFRPVPAEEFERLLRSRAIIT